MILALDPGYTRSAVVWMAGDRLVDHVLMANEAVLWMLPLWREHHLVIEKIASYGMSVGEETFATVFWSGRFAQAHGDWSLLFRREVKLALCGMASAKDTNIRQALIDYYGPSRALAIGTKKSPGPLYGLKADLWAALALGLTFHIKHGQKSEGS